MEDVEPTERVVFLQPWKKAGRQRLYVKDPSGTQVGHLDLISGDIHCEDSAWRDILNQLLPHYLRGNAPAVAQKDLSAEAKRGVRRFLDSLLGRPSPPLRRPLVVGRHWQNYGRHRLYVDRLDEGGTKTNLGWYDLDDQRCKCEQPGDLGLVAFCGARFKALSRKDPPGP